MFTSKPHDLLRHLRFGRIARRRAGVGGRCTAQPRHGWWSDAAAAPDGLIPVGVRGPSRAERYGTHVRLDDVREVVTPESLVRRTSCRDVSALRMLDAVRPLLDDTGQAWGPTGSVGFELATGQPTATPDSDLDLVVRVRSLRDSLPLLIALHRQFRSLAARVDCQVETSSGAAALAELVGDQPLVMVRTAEGPRLIARAAVS